MGGAITSFAREGSGIIFAGSLAGIYQSTDNGATWNLTNFTNQIQTLVVDSFNDLIAGTNFGVFISFDRGKTWRTLGNPFGGSVKTLAIDSSCYLFAGTGGGSVSRSVTQMIFREFGGIPKPFLSKSYPNPFTSKTTISFGLAVPGQTSLTVYNVLGQRIAVLVDGELPLGQHQFVWNAAGVPSGIYYYRLMVGGLNETQRLLLLH